MTNNNNETTTEPQTFKLTSDCVCVAYDEATGEWLPITEGVECADCWSGEVEYFSEGILSEWMEAHDLGFNDEIIIFGRKMNWDKVSGHKFSAPNMLVSALCVDGDFTLTFKLDGKTLTCVRTSHDETGGAQFAIMPIVEAANGGLTSLVEAE
jgi:hypothetical protein